MKELSIEEKAKRYDEALEKARQLCAYPTTKPFISDLQDLFPELKESEDEKLRKTTIAILKLYADKGYESAVECIAWLEKQNSNVDNANKEYWRGYREGKQEILDKYAELEKQGEQKLYVNDDTKEMFIRALERVEEQNSKGYKLTDCDKNSWWEDFKTYTSEQNLDNSAQTCKVEPKFKVGDWVVFKNKHQSIYQVEKIEDGYYNLRHTHGGTFRVCHDESLRLWTIEDAKDGDVLRLGYVIAIFKSIFKNSIGSPKCVCYCSFCENGVFEIPKENGEDNVYGCTNTTPATQEERDLLFAKMKEAGYKWKADTKELIKL